MTRRSKKCGDCGVPEGQLHLLGCDMEACPFCGGQLISCNCCQAQIGISFGSDIPKEWQRILNEKGRIPHILYPILCARCGKRWPDFFRVPDEEWEHYIQPDMRAQVICWKCYSSIKDVIDAADGACTPQPVNI